jgi:hypothetical protein
VYGVVELGAEKYVLGGHEDTISRGQPGPTAVDGASAKIEGLATLNKKAMKEVRAYDAINKHNLRLMGKRG